MGDPLTRAVFLADEEHRYNNSRAGSLPLNAMSAWVTSRQRDCGTGPVPR